MSAHAPLRRPDAIARATLGATASLIAAPMLLILFDRLAHAGLWATLPSLEPGREPSPRIAQPLGYWNAVGVWCAVAATVQLLAACGLGLRTQRFAGAVVPLVVATGYLTYSRGAILTALVGVAVALWLSPRRDRTARLLMAISVPAALAVAAVALDHDVAFGGSAARPITVLVLFLVAGLGAVLAGRADAISIPGALSRRAIRARAAVDRAVARLGRRRALVIAGALALALVAAGGERAAGSFTAPEQSSGDVRSRYGDLSSNGRIILWKTAWRTWRSHPSGVGSGGFRFAFDRVAPGTFTARDAHSLYLERLAERGTLGLAWLLAAMAFAAAMLVASYRSAGADRAARALVAAATAGLSVLMFGAGVDWYLEIPAVQALAFTLLAAGFVPLACRSWIGRVAVAGAVALVVAQAWPDDAARAISASQRAVRDGDLTGAEREARRAATIDPHQPDGFVQLGLVRGVAGDWPGAVRELRAAVRLQPHDWHAWALLARAQAQAGDPYGALGSVRGGVSARPNELFFGPTTGSTALPAGPRACSGSSQLERQHCDRLPRADGSWVLPGDPPAANAPVLPELSRQVLMDERMAGSWSRRTRAGTVLRLVEASQLGERSARRPAA